MANTASSIPLIEIVDIQPTSVISSVAAAATGVALQPSSPPIMVRTKAARMKGRAVGPFRLVCRGEVRSAFMWTG